MAKIKFGMMMTDARGKLGGQVFSKNRSGAYIRTKVTPSNPRTTRQSLVRQALAAISAAWSSLTMPEINGWNAAVNSWQTTNIFGDSQSPSGKTLFVKLNLNAANAGYPFIDNAPAKVDMPQLGAPSATYDIATGDFDISGLPNPLAGKIIVAATAPQTAGTRFFKGKFRQLMVTTAVAGEITGIRSFYINRFGTVEAGANIAVSVKSVQPNGQAGVEIVMPLIIT